MIYDLLKKNISVGIILLFVGITYAPAMAQNTEKQSVSRGNWLYVGGSGPGNYTKIQDAVDNASDGDTVFVFSGRYRQGEITINKRIGLIGENRNTTIYDGDHRYAFVITENNVNVSGFNITISQDAICIYSNNNTIMDNIFYSCGRGIHLFEGSSYNKISRNIFNCISWAGIWVGYVFASEYCSNNEISHNIISNCNTNGGILLSKNRFILICNNYFGNNSVAINFWDAGSQITICNNIFYKNEKGIFIMEGKNIIKNNNFILNKVDASFLSWYESRWELITSDKIEWNHNYWNRPRLLPKPIRGLNQYNDWYGQNHKYYWYHIDWFPASQPNDIVI